MKKSVNSPETHLLNMLQDLLEVAQKMGTLTYTRDGDTIEVRLSGPQAKVIALPNQDLNLKIWDAYHQAMMDRYKHAPIRNAKVNRNISDLGKRLGADAIEVVRFYVSHNDSFYLKKAHDIGLCLKDAEALHTQWSRGVAITNKEVRQFENFNFFKDQMERVGKV